MRREEEEIRGRRQGDIINLENSDTHRTEDRVVDGAFCSSTDDGSESRCDGDVTVDAVGDVTMCTSTRDSSARVN